MEGFVRDRENMEAKFMGTIRSAVSSELKRGEVLLRQAASHAAASHLEASFDAVRVKVAPMQGMTQAELDMLVAPRRRFVVHCFFFRVLPRRGARARRTPGRRPSSRVVLFRISRRLIPGCNMPVDVSWSIRSERCRSCTGPRAPPLRT